MKYKEIIQELRESQDLNVQIFLNDVEKIIKLSQKEKKSLLTKLQNPGVIDTLVKNYIPTIIRFWGSYNTKTAAPGAKPDNRFQWVRNEQGIRVKKCCASCAHKDLTRAISKRYCSISGGYVDPLDVCESWEMSDQMKLAGLLQ